MASNFESLLIKRRKNKVVADVSLSPCRSHASSYNSFLLFLLFLLSSSSFSSLPFLFFVFFFLPLLFLLSCPSPPPPYQECKAAIKEKFVANKNIRDLRTIDYLVAKGSFFKILSFLNIGNLHSLSGHELTVWTGRTC